MKSIYGAVVLAVLALLSSACTKEQGIVSGREVEVSFSACLPMALTKAYSDGCAADKLSYAVYVTDAVNNVDTYIPVASKLGVDAFGGAALSEPFVLKLATGKTYTIICWASNSNAPYSFDPETQVVSMNYSAATACNNENLDAFCGRETFTVKSSVAKTIWLHRPFAQINFGTGDYKDAYIAGLVPATTGITVKSAYTAINLRTDALVGAPTSVSFAPAAVVAKYDESADAVVASEAFPVDNPAGLEYLGMAYVLADKEIANVALDVYDAASSKINTVSVNNVPVRRNHRTNIFGSLLTNSVDFTVEVKPGYDGKFDEEQ